MTFDVTTTIIAQYRNSPVLVAILTSLAESLDQIGRAHV